MKDSVSIYLKFILCIVSIGAWSFWLNQTQPESKSIDKPSIVKSKKKHKKKISKPLKSKEEFTNIQRDTNDPLEINKEVIHEVKHETKKEEEPTITIKQPTPIPPPEDIAQVKSKENKKETSIENNTTEKPKKPKEIEEIEDKQSISLRNELFLDKSKQKELIDEFKKDISDKHLKASLHEGWIPIYIQKREEIKSQGNTNIDNLINDLELIGILDNTKGQQVAVLKIKSTNKVKYLATGDSLNSLILTSIQDKAITLKNETLEKEFTKELKIIEN